ncbi:MAG: hypothetical protein SPG80_04850 [Candidatus Ventricola sp.]|nr:hypothetical protein [Candidatus Ventricola sp.]
MANTIEKVALIQTTLDKAMIQGAVTGFMEGNVGNLIYKGGDEVKIPMIDMDGLANYNRQSGFVDGDTTLAYQTMKMTQDRGRGFTVDPNDIDESGVLDLMSQLAGEFQRTKVVPEVDAYRISKVVQLTPSENRTVYTPAAGTILKKMQEDIGAVRDTIGSDEQLVMLVSTPVSTTLNTSTELGKKLDVTDFMRGEITTKVKSLDGVPLLVAPSARMFSRITLLPDGKGGFTKAEGAAAINYIIMPRSAAIAVSKTDNMRLFDPQTWQKAHAWHMDYRKFHDIWIPKNRLAGIRTSMAAADTGLGS